MLHPAVYELNNHLTVNSNPARGTLDRYLSSYDTIQHLPTVSASTYLQFAMLFCRIFLFFVKVKVIKAAPFNQAMLQTFSAGKVRGKLGQIKLDLSRQCYIRCNLPRGKYSRLFCSVFKL